jgi:hypothetical protein
MRQGKIEAQPGAFFSAVDRPESALDNGFRGFVRSADSKILHIGFAENHYWLDRAKLHHG